MIPLGVHERRASQRTSLTWSKTQACSTTVRKRKSVNVICFATFRTSTTRIAVQGELQKRTCGCLYATRTCRAESEETEPAPRVVYILAVGADVVARLSMSTDELLAQGDAWLEKRGSTALMQMLLAAAREAVLVRSQLTSMPRSTRHC